MSYYLSEQQQQQLYQSQGPTTTTALFFRIRQRRRQYMSLLSILSLILFLQTQLQPTHAHSFLTFPEPYTRCDNRGRHICPPLMHNKDDNCVKKRTSVSKPAAVWKRGQKVTIKWARNNHNGGFINLAFVPVSRMFDGNAISRLTFYYGCWEQGLHPCRGHECGTDHSKLAFRRPIYVPAVIPDGPYVLFFLWYGGIDQPRTSARFGDYSSCSYVQIKGGARLRRKPFNPFFVAGNPKEKRKRKTCKSYTSKPGACRNGGCVSIDAQQRRPYPFNLGLKPPPLFPKLYHKQDRRKAICNNQVCCPKKCRLCEGFNCGRRKGGAKHCCPARILTWAPKCKYARKAPCIK